jgi:hypothetical protein
LPDLIIDGLHRLAWCWLFPQNHGRATLSGECSNKLPHLAYLAKRSPGHTPGLIPIVNAAKIGQSINKKRSNRSASRSSIPVRSSSFFIVPELTQVFEKKVDHNLFIR